MSKVKSALVLTGLLFLLLLTAATGLQGAADIKVDTGGPGPLTPGYSDKLAVTLAVSAPANKKYLVVGEKATVTVTLKDQLGRALTPADFSTIGLYMYGPQETTKTVTAVKLLNASTDRSKTPHHYIDLLTNADVKIKGNVLTYALKAVSDEAPGTYTAALRAALKADALQQVMLLVDFQLGTATVETQVVSKDKCAACHLGASSGQFYFAHTDVGRSPVGNPAIDSWPVRTCKACHNNDGYAAYSGDVNNPTGPTTVKTPDPIVRRVHGVHMGEELKNPFNTNPVTGNFKAYTGLLFPPAGNVLNCNACHVDDRFKTKPSREACGACHDNVWFGEAAKKPATAKAHIPQASDAMCKACHPADSGGVKPVAEAHKFEQKMNKIDISITAPAKGKFYTAGDKPVLTIVIKDDKDNPIDHTKVDNTNFSTASLFVYGPRYNSKPVLTSTAMNGNSKARASASSSIAAKGTPTKGWTFAAGDTFRIAVHGGAVQDIAAPVGLQTPDQVRDWLKANLKDVTVTSNNTAGSVNIRSNIQGANSKFEIYNSAVTKTMGWKPGPLDITHKGVVVRKTAGTTVEPFVVIGNLSTPANSLLKLSDPLDYQDPNVTRSAANITYQLSDVAGLTPGTYMIYSYVLPVAGKLPDYTLKTGTGFMTFQVGTEKAELKVATNCTACHKDTIWHLQEGPIHAEPFDTDYCKACHDYGRSGTGDLFSRIGGNSTSGWAGFGAKPIAARLHGVHRGAYLDHPEQVYAGNPNAFSEVIFPQDIRNCVKCHDPKTTSGTWKTNPSRLACLSCHDSDPAKAHASLQTVNSTPADPYGDDAVETCKVCHGAGKEFSPDKVHNISNPYKPPYIREPEK